MSESHRVQCPYCYETVEIWIPRDERGEMIRDCDVCCRPWQLHVRRTSDGSVRLRVSRAQ